MGSGKNFSGGPDHKTPSFWGTGGGTTIRASYAFGPTAFSPQATAVENQTMYGTQYLLRVDEGIAFAGPQSRTNRNGPSNLGEESVIKRTQKRKKEIENYLSQLTSKDTEHIMADIEGAAMRQPSPNRDDELDYA